MNMPSLEGHHLTPSDAVMMLQDLGRDLVESGLLVEVAPDQFSNIPVAERLKVRMLHARDAQVPLVEVATVSDVGLETALGGDLVVAEVFYAPGFECADDLGTWMPFEALGLPSWDYDELVDRGRFAALGSTNLKGVLTRGKYHSYESGGRGFRGGSFTYETGRFDTGYAMPLGMSQFLDGVSKWARKAI